MNPYLCRLWEVFEAVIERSYNVLCVFCGGRTFGDLSILILVIYVTQSRDHMVWNRTYSNNRR